MRAEREARNVDLSRRRGAGGGAARHRRRERRAQRGLAAEQRRVALAKGPLCAVVVGRAGVRDACRALAALARGALGIAPATVHALARLLDQREARRLAHLPCRTLLVHVTAGDAVAPDACLVLSTLVVDSTPFPATGRIGPVEDARTELVRGAIRVGRALRNAAPTEPSITRATCTAVRIAVALAVEIEPTTAGTEQPDRGDGNDTRDAHPRTTPPLGNETLHGGASRSKRRTGTFANLRPRCAWPCTR